MKMCLYCGDCGNITGSPYIGQCVYGIISLLIIQRDMKTSRFCIEYECINFVFNSNKGLSQNLLYTEALQKEICRLTQPKLLTLCLVTKGKV